MTASEIMDLREKLKIAQGLQANICDAREFRDIITRGTARPIIVDFMADKFPIEITLDSEEIKLLSELFTHYIDRKQAELDNM